MGFNKQKQIFKRKLIKIFNLTNKNEAKITSMPGADQWIIGNSMTMFGLLRVNYDHQNWIMLTEKLRNSQNFGVSFQYIFTHLIKNYLKVTFIRKI